MSSKQKKRKPKSKSPNSDPNRSESASKELSFDSIGQSDEREADLVEEKVSLFAGLRVFMIAMLSFGLLWCSFPPVGIWWLAWIAPAPLVWLVLADELPGRRPYWQLYFAGMIYWLATFYFVPIPHPALWLAWIVLCVYLAVYVPLLIGISRTMVRRLKLPAIICIPVAWTGLEWIRGHFATGHSFACLSHTQYQQPMLIQVADIFGAYTITFAIVWVAVGVAALTWKLGKLMRGPDSGSKSMKTMDGLLKIGSGFLMLGAVAFYGHSRLEEPVQYKNESVAKIALIQTSNDVVFRPLTETEEKQIINNKRKLTQQARQQWDDLDLIIWPESAFNPFVDLISNMDEEATVEAVANVRTRYWSDVTGYPNKFASPVSLLTGGQTQDPDKKAIFNSAFLIGTDGTIQERYYKNHLVMVGEYVPLGEQIPLLEQLSPSSSINAGDEFANVNIGGVNFAPNICFESTVPHFMLRQVNSLAEQGSEPDAMVNLTNDGWFFGTSCLDMHLACNVMRAVELRKPHLVASNTGFSANIDTCGRIIESGPRRAEAVLKAEIRPIERTSFYRQTGEIVPMVFGYTCVVMALIGWLARFFNRRPNIESPDPVV